MTGPLHEEDTPMKGKKSYLFKIIHGEYEFNSCGTVEARNDEAAWKKADEKASEFYGEGDPKKVGVA